MNTPEDKLSGAEAEADTQAVMDHVMLLPPDFHTYLPLLIRATAVSSDARIGV